MEYLEIKDFIEKKVAENHQEIIAFSDDLWAHPELSSFEFESSKKVAETMRKHGYEVEIPFCDIPTALRAIAGPNNHKHKVAILAEYDALPDIGHACGHNVSCGISMLAALATKDLQDELDCDIHLIGTPYEETLGSKVDMVNKGIFDNYDMAIMIHLYDKNLVTCNLLALHELYITFNGKATHGAVTPWEGVNALNAGQLFMHAIDCFRQHVTPDVRMHGVFTNGGGKANIVPEKAEIEIYTRSLNKNYLTNIVDTRVSKMIEGACLMTGATADVEVRDNPYDNLLKNSLGNSVLSDTFKELGIKEHDFDGIFGSSDIGNVSFVCPAFHPTLQIVPEGIAIHTRDFAEAAKSEVAHNALALGAKVIGLQIGKIFSNEELIKKMKDEFEATKNL